MTESSRDYRAFMSCAADSGWLTEVQRQLGGWLRERDLDVDVFTDVEIEQDNRTVHLQHHKDAQARSMRARLVETGTPNGTWSTELVARERRDGDGWVSVTVDNDQNRFVDTPRIAKYLMQTLSLGDGAVRFVDRPQLYGSDDVDRLVDLLGDEERHGLVFVVGTADDGLPFESFVKRVNVWTGQVFGLAQVIVLDPHATRRFNSAVPSNYQAPRWGIRSFYPAVDLGSPLDWRRHRVLGPVRLGEMEDPRIRRMLGGIARAHAAARTTPIALARAVRTFDRLANSAILKAIDPGTAAAPDVVPAENQVASEAESYLGQIHLVKSILQVDVLDEVTLRAIAQAAAGPRVEPSMLHTARRRIDQQQTHIEKLEDALREADYALDSDQLEHAELYDELERSTAEVRWLREKLRSQGDYAAAHGVLPEGWQLDYPQSFGDLIDRLPDLADGHIVFTGDRDIAVAVDVHDTLQNAVRTAWTSCLALEGYLRARNDGKCDNGVDHYLRHTPSGYAGITAGKHGQGETGATMRSFGKEREFIVPRSVRPAGTAIMKAHFKLARIGRVSPRMHYLDDYPATGSVYIGYIGPHLTITQTN